MRKRFRFLAAAAIAGAFALAVPAQGQADDSPNINCDNGEDPVVFAHVDQEDDNLLGFNVIYANVRLICTDF